MDIKTRKAYALIKQVGVRDAVVLNDGLVLAQLLPAIGRALMAAPNRYEGLNIDIAFTPHGETLNDFERDTRLIMAGLDLKDVEIIDDDDPAMLRWNRNPMNPESDSYDVLYVEYVRCSGTHYRERKTTEDLATLRKHVESHYANTEWWDGSHKW